MSFDYAEEPVQEKFDVIEVYSFKTADSEPILRQLGAINFAEIFDRMDVEEAFEYFFETLNRLIAEHVPITRINAGSNRPKLWTREWQQKKNKRDKEYKPRLNMLKR
mgnify:CR=1 FL=1